MGASRTPMLPSLLMIKRDMRSLRKAPRGKPPSRRDHRGPRREWRGPILLTNSAVPAELLGLAGRTLREHDVHKGGAAEVHGLVEGSAQVLWVLDKEAPAAEGLHDPVIAST